MQVTDIEAHGQNLSYAKLEPTDAAAAAVPRGVDTGSMQRSASSESTTRRDSDDGPLSPGQVYAE